jgi:hypothetical protein
MFIPIITSLLLLSLSPTLVAAAVEPPMSQCDVPTFAIAPEAGSFEHQHSFCATRYQEGYLINKIKVFKDNWGIDGMEITYTDGAFTEIGNLGGESQEIEWNPAADKIQEVKIWPTTENFNLGSLGHIYVKVSNGRTLDFGKDVGSIQGQRLDIGPSGFLLGITGKYMDDRKHKLPNGAHALDGVGIRALKWIFSKEPVASVSYDEMKFSPSVEELNARSSNEWVFGTVNDDYLLTKVSGSEGYNRLSLTTSTM